MELYSQDKTKRPISIQITKEDIQKIVNNKYF